MNKRQKGIMVWILVWAGLLIAVLYSPVGSPGLYSSQNYYSESQGISFQKGTIQHASNINSSSSDNENGLNIPDISTVSESNYAIGVYPSTNVSSRESSYEIEQTHSYQNSNPGSGGMNGGGTSIIASGGSRNSAGTSGVVMTNGITTLSLTSDISNNNKQSVTSGVSAITGGTDPGGDPTGDPIPVGDGWGLLVLFGAVYAILKRKSVA